MRTSGFLRLTTLIFALLLSARASGQTSFPSRNPILPFAPEEVQLLDGPLRDAFQRDLVYVRSLNPDRLLHNFRLNAGLPSTAVPMGGWEKPDCELRGHFTGHYLTACALLYSATGDTMILRHAQQVVAGLADCQRALGPSGYLSAFPESFIDRVIEGKRVWAPWYTLHKIYAGLLDMAILCHDHQALEILKKVSPWIKSRIDPLTDSQMQNMLKTEFGGMGEVLANLYAETGDSDDLALARRFDKRSFTDPLAQGIDRLKGLHANTHIPQAIAAARLYELTGESRYRDIASFFWRDVVAKRTYVTGGTSNYEYWRTDPGDLTDELSDQTHENCCSYNMLRLSRHIFAWTGDPAVGDYYERTLWNAVLPTQNPDDGGGLMYYVPLHGGLFKLFGVPDSSYWCCNGTGIESFASLSNSIYFHDSSGIYVALYAPSALQWKERGVSIRQETRYPEGSGIRFHVALSHPEEFTIHLRIPGWVKREPSLAINGNRFQAELTPGTMVGLHRTWKNGDVVELVLPMSLGLSYLAHDSSQAAVTYGPVVLAGELGTEEMTRQMQEGFGYPDVDRMASEGPAVNVPALMVQPGQLEKRIRPVDGEDLTFRTVGAGDPSDVSLIPFFRLFHQRYAVYWT
ncbi:MAG: beta-L-arabinofuranosidase domain-containing protein, partial [Bacteroidota bacterium]